MYTFCKITSIVFITATASQNSKSCMVTIHTSKEVVVEKILPSGKKYETIFAQALYELAVAKGKRSDVRLFSPFHF